MRLTLPLGLAMPTRRFLLIVTATFVIASAGLYAFHKSDYRLGFDVQRFTGEPVCLSYFAFLIHYGETTPRVGDFVVAAMPDTGLPIGGRPGASIVKKVMGVPGDHIRIEGTELYINGLPVDRLWLAKSIPGKKIGDFDTSITLGPDQYFLMGTTKESFDSRYWGPVSGASIRGSARPLL